MTKSTQRLKSAAGSNGEEEFTVSDENIAEIREHSVRLRLDLTNADVTRRLIVLDDDIPVNRDEEVKFEVVNPSTSLLSVEVHFPGNAHYRISFGKNAVLKNVLDVRRPFAGKIKIGPTPKAPRPPGNPNNKRYPYKVYAHVKGSIVTYEGRTTGGTDPAMIIE